MKFKKSMAIAISVMMMNTGMAAYDLTLKQ